jgi:methyl coenzyme M reductase beta subunit
MKTLAFLFTGAAALALSACGGTEETPTDGETDVTVIEENDAVPVATETVEVDSDDPDSVTVSEDGVSVDVDSDNTRVRADEDGASVTVSE